MVANFVRLKLALLGNVFRRSIWQTIGFAFALLSALGTVITVVGLAVIGARHDAALTGELLVLAGALLVLGWWLIPLFVFGVDATLDPQRFVLYPIPRRKLLLGLAVAGLLSVPGIATTLAVLGTSFAWAASPMALLAALLGAVGAVALCVVGSRALTTLAAPVLETRRARELLSVAAFVLIMLASPLINAAVNVVGTPQADGELTFDGVAIREQVHRLAEIVGWTPFGAPWALAEAVAHGEWLRALAHLGIISATLALAWWAWAWALRRALERPARPTTNRAAAKGLGFFDRFAATPTGAVAARSATYWVRDPRYGVGLIAIVLMPLVLAVPGLLGGQEAMPITLLLAPLVAWLLGFSLANDVATDNTAFALHVISGVSGRADRLGRILPVLIAGAPVTTAFAVVSVWLNRRWDWLPPVLGLTWALLLSSAGIASAASARWVYPAVKPGESPLRQPQGAAMATMVAQSVSLALSAAAGLIPTGLAVAALVTHGPRATVLGWLTLVFGLAIGAGVLVFGVRWGGRLLERRAPEILQQIKAFP